MATQTNFKKIKNLIVRLEKKERELASYNAKISKLNKEIAEIQSELNTLLGNKQTTTQQSYNF
jgi:chromosome segregation ATPase